MSRHRLHRGNRVLEFDPMMMVAPLGLIFEGWSRNEALKFKEI